MAVSVPGPSLRPTCGRHILLTAVVAVVLSGPPAFGVWRLTLARRIDRDRAEQRAVRQYGLTAAESARRDLARHLHDDVIPDLAGVSLLLEAARAEALRPETTHPGTSSASTGACRRRRRQLRALLDELVPSASTAEQPETALRELANRLRRSSGDDGPAVEIDVAGTTVCPSMRRCWFTESRVSCSATPFGTPAPGPSGSCWPVSPTTPSL